MPLGTPTGPDGGEKASRRQRGTQRAPTSCVAPPGVAEARAAQWAAVDRLDDNRLAFADPTLSGRINLFPLPRSCRGAPILSYAAERTQSQKHSPKAPWPFPALFGPPPRRKFGRRPPRRFAPGRIGRAMRSIATSSAQSSKAPAGRRQRKELRAPSSSSHRPRWRRLAHSAGVQFSCLPTAAAKVQPLSAQCRLVEAGGPDASPRGGRNFVAAPPATGPSPKKNLAPRSLSARQRNPVQTRALRLNDFATLGAARAPTGCSTGPPVATCMVRALAEIDQTTFGCLIDFLLQQSRAGAARHSKAGVGSATSYDCPPRAAAQLRLR